VAGAAANALPGAVPDEVKAERRHRFMAAQQAISARRLAGKVGRRVPVIVDESTGTSGKGRTVWDAPEIDGTVHIVSRRPVRVGDIVTVKVHGQVV
jgi:ribosomal protein S12 methylthiotransferase